ncbi:MAG: Fe-S cluster assembly protein SufD [Actinobacteria bacterium]|nr:Fe-S cluster assembly protein SufD [Actinomycetota bacterium]MCA1721222.1 Fe-S cluster assembly protein SufD [Actinomycetota bacterium]
MASNIADVLATERTALKETGGVTDGSLAANVKPSTPRSPADVRPERITAREVDAFPVVTGREEEWRFTPVDRLRVLLDGATSSAKLQWKTELPDGVTLREVSADDPLLATVPNPVDRLSALAMRNAAGATVISIPAEAQVTEPVLVDLRGTGGDEVVWGHVVLEVGRHAKATVVLEHGGDARYAGCVSVLVGDGAHLDLVGVQEWDSTAVHAQHTAIRVGRDARVRSIDVTLGGDVVRLVKTVEYAGPGGDAELLGLYFADGGQHLEHRLFVDHGAPSCRSRVTYKGALQGDSARTVWVGDVLIRAGATGTDTYELNRNLLLTPEARADSVPNLEIETGEILGAGHASATGRFDDEQLFYLQARGIPADEARRMVVRGFFADVINEIGIEHLEERLLAAVEAELERTKL